MQNKETPQSEDQLGEKPKLVAQELKELAQVIELNMEEKNKIQIKVDIFKRAMSAISQKDITEYVIQKHIVFNAPEGIGDPLFIVGYSHPQSGRLLNGERNIRALYNAQMILLTMGDNGVRQFHIEGLSSDIKINAMQRKINGKEYSVAEFRKILSDFNTFRGILLTHENSNTLGMDFLAQIILACAPEMECYGAENKEIMKGLETFVEKEYGPALIEGKACYERIVQDKDINSAKDCKIEYQYKEDGTLLGITINGYSFVPKDLKSTLTAVVKTTDQAISYSDKREEYVRTLPGQAVLFGNFHLKNFEHTKSKRTLGLINPKDTEENEKEINIKGDPGILYTFSKDLLQIIEDHSTKK